MKDIVEEAIEDKLDNNHFPFLGGQRQNKGGAATTRFVTLDFESRFPVNFDVCSARYGGWHKDKKDQTMAKSSPRIMVRNCHCCPVC